MSPPPRRVTHAIHHLDHLMGSSAGSVARRARTWRRIAAALSPRGRATRDRPPAPPNDVWAWRVSAPAPALASPKDRPRGTRRGGPQAEMHTIVQRVAVSARVGKHTRRSAVSRRVVERHVGYREFLLVSLNASVGAQQTRPSIPFAKSRRADSARLRHTRRARAMEEGEAPSGVGSDRRRSPRDGGRRRRDAGAFQQ